jgi:muconate cycloisomerase
VNGSVETGVGNAANLHLAVSTAVASLACVVPVSTPAGKAKGIAGVYYTDDLIVEPFEYDDGCVVVSDKPGLGIEVDESKLKHYRIE